MRIDRPFLGAWIFGVLVHGMVVFTGYRVTPASGKTSDDALVPIEIVRIESEPAAPVPEPEPAPTLPVPDPDPEPAAVPVEPSPTVSAEPEGDAGSIPEPVFGLNAESIGEDDGEGAETAPGIPVGNTVALPRGERPDSVQALTPVPYHLVSRPPEVLEAGPPVYPSRLREAGIQGRVIVEMVIDTEGIVREAKVIKSDHDGFGEAALQAARKMRFKPGYQGDRPVPVRILMPFDFKIH